MKNTILIFITSILITLSSCFDDKGNYDYSNPEENVISNIEGEYNLMAYKDTLKIVPDFKGINENENTTYLWTIYSMASKDEDDQIDYEKLSNIIADTISEERNLNYAIFLSNGSYRLNYEVKDGLTGLVSFFTTYLNVSTEFSKGFYLLKETSEGNSEIDVYTVENSLLENLLANISGTTLKGSPLSFGMWPLYSYLNTETQENDVHDFLLPITKDGELAMIRIEDFKKIRDFDDMFYDDEDKGRPLMAFPNCESYGFNTTKGYFRNSQVSSVGMLSSGYFGNTLVPEDEPTNYEFNSLGCLYGKGTLLYDKLYNRFMAIDYRSGNIHAFSDENSSYSMNNIEDEIIYIGGGSVGSSNYAYGIFNIKGSNQKRIYAIGDLDLKKYTNTVDAVIDIPLDAAMTNANLFACSKQAAELIYFVSDNKIYTYKSYSQTEDELTIEGLPQDEEITYIDNIFTSNSGDANFDYLIVGTYKDGNYSVYMYNTMGGIPVGGPQKTVKGKGKIAKIQYMNIGINNDEEDRLDNLYSVQF